MSNLCAWDLGSMLESGLNWFTENAQRAVLLVGAVILLWAIVSISRNVWASSHGHGGPPPVKWSMVVAGGIFAGVCLFGGYVMFAEISRGGQDTLVKWGNSTSSGISINPNLKGSTGLAGSGAVDLAAQAEAVRTWAWAMFA